MRYRFLGLVAAAAIAWSAVPAFAQNAPGPEIRDADTGAGQDFGTTSREDIFGAPRTMTVPEDGTIIIGHSVTKNVYFRYPFKSITLGDDTVVKAVPVSNHVIAFTGLAAGESSVTVERENGVKDKVAVVTTTGSASTIRIYPGKSGKRRSDNNEATADNLGRNGYYTVICNDIGCGNAIEGSNISTSTRH
jgi:hypothetical protein